MAPDQRHLAWDIHARKLWALGHGHPVWQAAHKDELTVGAVGSFDTGAVLVFFDVLKSVSEQKRHSDGESALPPGFVPLDATTAQFDEQRDAIPAGLLCRGMNLHPSNALSDGGANSVVPRFRAGQPECTPFDLAPGADAGAALELASAADTRELTARAAIVSYIGTHFRAWDAHTNGVGDNELGIGIRPDELLFVSGLAKTAGWASLAVSAPSVRAVSRTSGDVTVTVREELEVSAQSHWGGAWPHADAAAPRENTVFVHYYKAKPRDGGIMGSQEGYNEDEEDEESAIPPDEIESMAETGLPRLKEFDPVGALLDYILENSEADLAIASTRDVYALRPEDENEWADIPALLNKVRPTIHVDERGVGTISAAPGLQVDQAGAALDGN